MGPGESILYEKSFQFLSFMLSLMAENAAISFIQIKTNQTRDPVISCRLNKSYRTLKEFFSVHLSKNKERIFLKD